MLTRNVMLIKKLQFRTDYSKEDLLPLHICTFLHIK